MDNVHETKELLKEGEELSKEELLELLQEYASDMIKSKEILIGTNNELINQTVNK